MQKKIIEDINNLPKISEVIKNYNLSAKSFLSQNFILDIKLTTHISKLSGSLKEKSVIEIGPGPGALTRSLIINGAKKIESWTGLWPKSHRAGSYGANEETYKALEKAGIFIDSSIFWDIF